ncbi:hypothetical protein BH10ACI3_BH10ACI3_04140 [soil metagenome]
MLSQDEKELSGPNMTQTYLKLFPVLILVTICASAVFAKPDLIVSSASVTRDASGRLVERITITVTNACRNQAAGTSYVLVTFKENERQGAKTIYFVGNTVKALKGGESFIQTFDVSVKRIPAGNYIYIEVDPYKKVAEANENNNWRSLFPDAAGTVLSAETCSK